MKLGELRALGGLGGWTQRSRLRSAFRLALGETGDDQDLNRAPPELARAADLARLAGVHVQVRQLQMTSWSLADEHIQGFPPQTGAAHWQVTGSGAHGLSSQL